jgi:hypothetical protein
MWGLMAYNWLGADVEVSSRGAIALGMQEFVLDLMFSESSLGEKVVGAFGMVPSRAFQAWGDIKPMLLSDREEPLTSAEVLEGVSSLLAITSTWNNIQKGVFMQNMGQLVDSRGNVLVENGNFNLATEVATMIGFQPSEAARTRQRESLVRARQEHRAAVADAVVQHYWNYVNAIGRAENDTEKAKIIRHYTLGTEVIMKSLGNEGERQKVRESVNARLERSDDRMSRSIKAYIEEFSDGRVLDMSTLIEAMKSKGIIRNDMEFPEDTDEDNEE